MEILDGLYRHRGAIVTWDRDGVTLLDSCASRSTKVAWDQIVGARQVGGAPGYVQLLLRGHAPSSSYRDDHLAFPVNSDEDANRLLTSIRWYAGTARQPSRRSQTWRARDRRRGLRTLGSPMRFGGRRRVPRDENNDL